MTLRGFFYDEENEKAYRKTVTVEADNPAACGEAGQMLAKEILSEVR